MLGKIENKSGRGQQRMRRWDGVTDSRGRGLSKPWETAEDKGAWCAEVQVTQRWTRLSD